MRLRNLLAATAVGSLALGAVGIPAYSVTAPQPSTELVRVAAWGDPNDRNAGLAAITVPGDLGNVTSVAASPGGTGAVTADGRLRLWGTGSEVTEAPDGVTDATAIVMGSLHAAVLHADGRVEAWGQSDALDNVPSELRAKAIAIAGNVGYAVHPDGTLSAWGGTAGMTPLPTPALTNLVDVSAGLAHTVALKADGTIAIWDAGFLPGLAETPDFGGKKVVKVLAGYLSSMALLEDGTIKNWGFMVPADAPTFNGLTPATTVVSISMATLSAAAAAVTADGVVHTWGTPPAVSAVPASLAGKPVRAIALGETHAAVIVAREASTTSLSVSPPTAVIGATRTATATVTTNGSSEGGTVTFKTGTTTRIAPVINGKATWTLPFQAVGRRSVTASYSGSVSSLASTATPVTFKVTKAASRVKAKAKANRKAKKVTFTITATTAKGVSPTGKVTISLKGKTKKTVSVRVNAKGKATVIVKRLKAGKYTVKLKYAGNGNVSGSNGSVKFKI
jgi:hypothetical protein